MILEMLRDKPCTIDGVEKFYNLQLNVADKNRLRLKAISITDKGEIPVDIVIYQYSNPMLVKTSIAITFDGKEMKQNLPFKGKLSFDFLKKVWKLRGNMGEKSFDDEFEHLVECITVIAELYNRDLK